MGSKQKARKRPAVQSIQMDRLKRDEFQECATPSCRNVLAIWSKSKICAICRSVG